MSSTDSTLTFSSTSKSTIGNAAMPAEPGAPVDPEAGSSVPKVARISGLRTLSLNRPSSRGRQLKDSPRLPLRESPRGKPLSSPRPALKDRDSLEALRADVVILQKQVKTLQHELEVARSENQELQIEKNDAENAFEHEHERREHFEKSLHEMTEQCRYDQTRAVRAEEEYKVVVHGLQQEISILKQERERACMLHIVQKCFSIKRIKK